jgi:hypothetical protein
MPHVQMMSMAEEAAIMIQALELKKQGRLDEYMKMRKQVPLQPYLAKFAKEHFGADFLIKSGWNLAEADTEYGSDWLTR